MEPADCLGLPISDLLFHDDAAVFAEATRQLEADIGHTVEVRFRLRVATSPPSSRASSEESRAESEEFFELMEGKGMLMTDGLTGSSSHTMWVVRPAPLSPSLGAVDAAPKSNAERIARLRALQPQAYADPLSPFAFGKGFALEPILCRICERGVPAWFFEKHNETCHESHRLESDISECNDRIKELLRTIEAISTAIDDPAQTAQYRDIAYEQDLEPFANARLTAAQQESLLELRDILQTALDIGTPGMSEDDASDKPIEQQRLLSPDSDRKLSEIMNWQRPASDDAAMARLVSDVEEQIRYKLNSVNRLRNTLLYSEKVREEWEAKADALVADMDAAAASSAGSLPSSPQLQPPGKASETTAAETRPRSDSQAIDSEAPSSRLLEPMSHLSPVVAAEDEYTRARRKRSSIDPSHLARSDSPSLPAGLLSPRLPAGIPTSRSKVTSIKDFQVIKPISKGACECHEPKSLRCLANVNELRSWISLPGQEVHDRRLLRDQGPQEVGHGCQEPGHERQGRAHDHDEPDALGLCRAAILHVPEPRLPLSRDGVSRWRRPRGTGQEARQHWRRVDAPVPGRGRRGSRQAALCWRHSSVSLI